LCPGVPDGVPTSAPKPHCDRLVWIDLRLRLPPVGGIPCNGIHNSEREFDEIQRFLDLVGFQKESSNTVSLDYSLTKGEDTVLARETERLVQNGQNLDPESLRQRLVGQHVRNFSPKPLLLLTARLRAVPRRQQRPSYGSREPASPR
jgi:hypothetical protein